MNYVIDAILLAIIVITALISARYGFVRTLVELVGFVLIIMISSSLSVPIAEAIYDGKIESEVLQYTPANDDSVLLPAEDFIKSLPEYLTKDGGILSVNTKKITDCYNDNIKNGSQKIAAKINDDVIRPTVVKILSVIISAVLFAVLSVIVHIVARLLNTIIRHSFARGLNQRLGFLIGLVKGTVIAVIICLAVILYIKSTGRGIWIFTPEIIENSLSVKLIKSLLPNYGIFTYVL